MPVETRARMGLIARLLMALIVLYRWSLSFLIGGHCRFYPSCSTYGLDALRRHGALRGTRLIVARVLRCHPWHPGGFDPVPESHSRLRRDA